MLQILVFTRRRKRQGGGAGGARAPKNSDHKYLPSLSWVDVRC